MNTKWGTGRHIALCVAAITYASVAYIGCQHQWQIAIYTFETLHYLTFLIAVCAILKPCARS